MNIRKLLLSAVAPAPLPESKDYRRSFIWQDSVGQKPVDAGLVELSLKAGLRALDLSLDHLDDRDGHDGLHKIWPGEHYRLIAALIEMLQPKRIVEFGTYTGLSSLSMLSAMPADGRIDTYDVLAWNQFPVSPLREDDFKDGRIVQHVENLAESEVAEKNRSILAEADFLFIDGPKDGVTEPKLFENLKQVGLKDGAIMVIDDIFNYHLIPTWDAIESPKFNITSLGHWTGTGIVRWRN